MNRLWHVLLLHRVLAAGLILCSGACARVGQQERVGQEERVVQQEKTFDPTRWEKTIAAFEAKDRAAAPPKDAVLFVGSSSIVGWDLQKFFPGAAAINRGFGGSHIADSVHYVDRIVLPYRPAMIVFYAGENDVAAGRSPGAVADDFRQFVQKVRAGLPEVKIVYIGLKPSPIRWKLIEKFRQTNELIRKFVDEQKEIVFIDVERRMLGDDGQPRAELFRPDQLHMTAKGYEIWTELVLPHVKQVKMPTTRQAQ